MKPTEIKRIREKLNLDRDGFAKAFGLAGYQSVMNIETGFRKPNKLAIKLLRYLDSLTASKARDVIEGLSRHED